MVETIHAVLGVLALGLEVIGAAVIVATAVAVLWRLGSEAFRRQRLQLGPTRRRFGRGLVLGLEFLIGADILRTITAPTIEELITLAAVIVLRTILALSIEYEMRLEREEPRDEVP